MRYTFQDSTEFPVQRDFIQDIQDFIETAKKVIPLEKSLIEIKRINKQKVNLLERRIQEINEFEKDLKDYVESRTYAIKASDILEIKARTLEVVSTAALLQKNEKIEEINQQNRLDLVELQQLEERILLILSPFFENSIYGAQNAYSAWVEDKKLKGRQISFIGEMRYEFEIYFTQDIVKVKDLQAGLIIPVWVESGILSREKKVKNLDVSNFYIKNLESEGNNLTATLEDADSGDKFSFSANEDTFLILHRDYEITGDENLASSLDIYTVSAFIAKLRAFFRDFAGSSELRRVIFKGKNVFEENRVHDCLKQIASIYAPLITQAIERGYTEGEVAIKIESPEGIKTEKYLEKSEIAKELLSIGAEGEELAKTLKIMDA